MQFHGTCLILIACTVAAAPLAAQVHEAEPPVDLTRGLVSPTATAAPLGQKSFAVALLAEFPAQPAGAVIASQGDAAQGWQLLVTADGALRFEARTKSKPDAITVTTPDGVVAPGSKHHLVINILRDAAKPNAGIWVDGVELASGVVQPVDLSTPQPLTTGITADHVRLYHRELSRPEVLALQLEAMASGKPVAKHPAPPANGPRFIPQPGETITLIGGTEAVALAESGELEALLLMAFPQTRFHFRSLAWEGDTVFRQDRPMNFGSLEQQLRRVNAGSVFVMFGRQECLERGKEGLEEFKVAFGKLLEEVEKVTPNIVVTGPTWFEPRGTGGALFERLELRNHELHGYLDAMGEVSQKHASLFLDPRELITDPQEATMMSDGVNFSNYGARFRSHNILMMICRQLPRHDAELANRGHGELRKSVQTKNRLWHDYWRPSNWAFLFGDRTQQPSSRDPVNPQLRFFPAEQEKYLPLLKDAEEKIFKLVEEATKKLP